MSWADVVVSVAEVSVSALALVAKLVWAVCGEVCEEAARAVLR